jgi:hypothetical protein
MRMIHRVHHINSWEIRECLQIEVQMGTRAGGAVGSK